MTKESKDQLSEILDSFQNDDTMEKKIEDFAKKKERKTRVQKAKKEPEERVLLVEEKNKTPNQEEIKLEEKEEVKKPNSGGTMVFDKGNLEEDMNSGAHTVVMDNHEIQTLIDENKGPKLIHEESLKEKKNLPVKKKTNYKLIFIIISSVIGLVLIGVLVFGIIRVVSHSINSAHEQTSQELETAYNQIKDFIDSMGDDPQGLTAYESAYNKLSAEQKSKIDDLLRNKTGKSFSELIAQIQNQKEEDNKNNNTEIAEQKAKLKDQIATLQAQLQSAQSDLETIAAQYNQAQGALNSAVSMRDSAYTELQNAQNRYNQSLSQNQSKIADLQTQVDALTQERQAIRDSAEELSDADSQRMEEIQSQIMDLNSQIASLSNSVDQNTAYQVQSAQNAYDTANAQVQSAQNEVSSYQASLSSAQSKVDSINGQIAQLQSSLNALK